MELTEFEPDQRVVFHVTHPSLDWTAVSTLEAAGTGTRLTYAGELRMRGCGPVGATRRPGRICGGGRRW